MSWLKGDAIATIELQHLINDDPYKGPNQVVRAELELLQPERDFSDDQMIDPAARRDEQMQAALAETEDSLREKAELKSSKPSPSSKSVAIGPKEDQQHQQPSQRNQGRKHVLANAVSNSLADALSDASKQGEHYNAKRSPILDKPVSHSANSYSETRKLSQKSGPQQGLSERIRKSTSDKDEFGHKIEHISQDLQQQERATSAKLVATFDSSPIYGQDSSGCPIRSSPSPNLSQSSNGLQVDTSQTAGVSSATKSNSQPDRGVPAGHAAGDEQREEVANFDAGFNSEHRKIRVQRVKLSNGIFAPLRAIKCRSERDKYHNYEEFKHLSCARCYQ